MKVILLIVLVVCAVGAYYGITFKRKVAISSDLVARAKPFELRSENKSVTLLVLGDSTGVGVGADGPEDTVAGRFASEVGATYVENRAKSGAVVADLEEQIAGAEYSQYGYILIEIGGNDIIRFHGVEKEAQELKTALQKLPSTEKLIVHSAGNVGAATLFPKLIRPLHTKLNLKYHQEFEKIATEAGGQYVNLYKDPETDPFVLQPEVYLSADGLHPSSEGYRLWFEKVREAL